MQENVEECSFVSNARSKYKTVESPYIHDVAGRKLSLGFNGNISFDAGAENIQLSSKLKEAKLEIMELRLSVMQEDVAMKAMT